MTFVLHPFSHYNSITEPHAWFLLSLLEHLTIDFPSHFILSIIDVHLDSASRDKLIFPSAIINILRHFSISFLSFNHFTVMCAIDYATIKRREAQLRLWQLDSAAPSSHPAPSRSTPSISALPSSSGDVSLRYHGATAVHGCSPRYTLYRVVSDECSCQSYCTTIGVYGWFCSWGYSITTFSRGFCF